MTFYLSTIAASDVNNPVLTSMKKSSLKISKFHHL